VALQLACALAAVAANVSASARIMVRISCFLLRPGTIPGDARG
jgi:hypothetical protein